MDKIAIRHFSETKWHKLDNTATIFPVISNRNFSSVYRVSVRLKQNIVPELLQRALDDTMPWFESFNVRIRRGVFWYYFETNKKRPLISEEQSGPCGYIDPTANNNFLFRVSYFKRRINLEVFHAVTDGSGAINFLKELSCRYIVLANQEDSSAAAPELPIVEVTSDFEDSYVKNYTKTKKAGLDTNRSYQMKGDKLPLFSTGVVQGYLDTKSLLNFCRQKNITITQYFSAVLVWSMYKEFLNSQPYKYPIMIFVPVNLRPFFDSTSTLNFFSSITVGMKIERSDYTFDEVLALIAKQCKEQLTKEHFSQKIAGNVALGKNLAIRFLPRQIKNLIMKAAYLFSYKSTTITVSNLGSVRVPEKFKKYIEHFELLISVTDREPTKCGIVSFEDRLVVTFTSRLCNTYLQRAFFRKLSADGLDVVIESNGAYYENV